MRKTSSPLAWRLDCANLVRHLALCLAAAVALIYSGPLRVGDAFIGLIAVAALLNFLIAFLTDRAGGLRAARILSTASGLVGWTALAWATGGSGSPYLAGYGLEIVLSALTYAGWATLGVGAACLAGLWGLAAVAGLPDPLRPLVLQSGFLVALALVTLLLTRQWQRARDEWQTRHRELVDRLGMLEQELEGFRGSGPGGEATAHLAHSFKNAVHAMRGYTSLVQERLEGPDRNCRAIQGMQAAIERLEEVVREALGPWTPSTAGGMAGGGTEASRVIERVIGEVTVSHPEVLWARSLDEPLPAIAAPAAVVHEALLNLVRNAAEAMEGKGEITVVARSTGSNVEIEVRDRGRGIRETDRPRLFVPGMTSKPGGSGLGLFLARRLVESQGGLLRANPTPPGGGACFSIALPVQRS